MPAAYAPGRVLAGCSTWQGLGPPTRCLPTAQARCLRWREMPLQTLCLSGPWGELAATTATVRLPVPSIAC